MVQSKSKRRTGAKAAGRKMRPKARPKRPAARVRRPAAAAPHEAALAVFAHDIRTALTGILALGELLASSNLDERERRWAVGVKAGAEHLASLTTLVIDAAKAGSGLLTLQRQVFRPRRIADVLVQSLAARAQAKGLEAETTIAADLPERVVGDPVWLRAALENLIDNAVKFTDQGGIDTARGQRQARPRAGASRSSSASPTAASGSHPPRSSGCFARSRKRVQRLPAVMAAPALVSRWSRSWPS